MLQPVAKMTMTVQLPKVKLQAGQCVSTTQVMAKLKKKARPHHFKSLTVTKNTIEFIRLEGELSSKVVMELVISKLNRVELKVSGFVDVLKVKCAPLKIGASKYQWETYFRDDPKMDEKKAGYRPDTIHVCNLPVRWFGKDRPKTDVLLDVFSTFGEIRRFHIPLLDEMEMKAGNSFRKFSHSESLVFDAFIMYKDYVGFVKAMDALRGMKLVKKLREEEGDVLLEYDITVDFDKSKHLSDKAIRKRKLEKEYGIKNSEEVRKLKEDTKKRREDYEVRIKELVQRKNQAKRLLKLIFDKVAEREAAAQSSKSGSEVQSQQDIGPAPRQTKACSEAAKVAEPDSSSNCVPQQNQRIEKERERLQQKERLLAKEKQLRVELSQRTANVQKLDSANRTPLKSVVAASDITRAEKVDPCVNATKASLRSIVTGHAEQTGNRQQESVSSCSRPISLTRTFSSTAIKRSIAPLPEKPVRKKIVFDRSPDHNLKVPKLVITARNEDFGDSD